MLAETLCLQAEGFRPSCSILAPPEGKNTAPSGSRGAAALLRRAVSNLPPWLSLLQVRHLHKGGTAMSRCKLTVRFEEPFWIGLVEMEDGGTHRAEPHPGRCELRES